MSDYEDHEEYGVWHLPLMKAGVHDSVEAPEWVIEDLIPEGTTLVYGSSNVGKTFIMLHLALRRAAGERCFGRNVQQGTVLYIYSEGGRALNVRRRAAQIYGGLPSDLPLIILPSALSMGGDKSDAHVAGEIRRFCHYYDLPNVSLIIVDTVSANIGSNESETEGAQKFIRAVKALAEGVNPDHAASVILVHHHGKANVVTPRGSSVLTADIDAQVFIKGKGRTEFGHSVELICQKMRDGEYFNRFEVNLLEKDVIDANGELLTRRSGAPVTTLIVEDDVAEKKADSEVSATITALLVGDPGLSNRAVSKLLGRKGGHVMKLIADIRKSMEVIAGK